MGGFEGTRSGCCGGSSIVVTCLFHACKFRDDANRLINNHEQLNGHDALRESETLFNRQEKKLKLLIQ